MKLLFHFYQFTPIWPLDFMQHPLVLLYTHSSDWKHVEKDSGWHWCGFPSKTHTPCTAP